MIVNGQNQEIFFWKMAGFGHREKLIIVANG